MIRNNFGKRYWIKNVFCLEYASNVDLCDRHKCLCDRQTTKWSQRWQCVRFLWKECASEAVLKCVHKVESKSKMSGNYICWDHELDFPTEQALQNHLASECAKFLAKGAVCLFMDTEGQCCGKTFNHISSLMYHYFCKHRKYACAYCYQLFDHREDLDAHKHTAGRHLREGMYRPRSVMQKLKSFLYFQSHINATAVRQVSIRKRRRNNMWHSLIVGCRHHEVLKSPNLNAKCAKRGTHQKQ